jgi:hypothetical protein
MKRKTYLIALLLVSITFSMPFVIPASAATVYTENISIMGDEMFINIPNVSPARTLKISFAHFEGGTHGVRDNIGLYLYVPASGSTPARWALTAWYSDTDAGYAYISDLLANGKSKTYQLQPNELQVRGTTNVIGRWTVPLVSPAIPSWGLPEIVVPPGHITLNQYGDLMSGSITPVTFPSGFVFKVDWTGYAATGHVVIPQWGLDEQITGAKLNIDTIQTSTKP